MDDNIELMHNCDKNLSCYFTSFLSAKENNKMVKIGDFCTYQAGCTVYMLSVCRMSVVCQINCVGGITCGSRACSKFFFGG